MPVISKQQYAPEEELLLKEWCERATILRNLHHMAWSKYRKRNIRFTIPIIILTTVCGTLNVAQSRVPEAYMAHATIGIGVLNLLAGILTTIAGFLEIAKLETSHRVSSISWGKFARHWSTELARNPKDRIPVQEAMRSAKSEFDRLAEQSPPLPGNILREFKSSKANKIPDDYAQPEILDKFVPVRIYNHEVSTARIERMTSIEIDKVVPAASRSNTDSASE